MTSRRIRRTRSGGRAEFRGRGRGRWRLRARRCAAEAYESVRIVAAFVAFSALLGLTQPAEPSRPSPSAAARPTPPPVQAVLRETPTRWLVDGFNVLNVGLLRGVERERFWGPEARARLLALADRFPDAPRVVVIFDGPRPLPDGGDAALPRGASHLFARDADAWLLRAVRESEDPARVAVVTADRRLADRVRHRGAQVVAPSQFLAECGGETGARLVSLREDGDGAG